MQSKIIILLIIFSIIFTIPQSITTGKKNNWWDEQWDYRQEIIIPIDTSQTQSKYQPIDIKVEFENPCWAKNEQEHSIRIIYQSNNDIREIESQIYNLEYLKEYILKSCCLVFLIPEDATGQEKYYIYYDNIAKSIPDYIDRVKVEESYYKYEPIPGYPYESDFYKIMQDENIIYAIAQEGEVFGIGTSQQVTKLKPNSKKYSPSNGETLAFLDFWYYHDKGFDDYKTSCQKLVSKNINIDGNLMLELKLISQSNNNDIKSTVLYRYYYSPIDDTRIFAQIKHEILSDNLPETYDNYDGSYVSLQTGGLKSNTIKDLNAGKIYPYIHIFTEDETIRQFELYSDPEYNKNKWDITILGTKDDIDLGKKGWACYDEGETGNAHAIILGDTKVIKSGENEKDGIQVQTYETGYPDLPGLENNVASLVFGRNSYEKQGQHDKTIPNDFIVELNVELFSTTQGSYKTVDKEADIFQTLVKEKPLSNKVENENDEEIEKHNLTTYVHFAPSFPIGSILSATIGINFSFITAELYQDDEYISSNIVNRITFNKLPDLKNGNIFDKIKSIFEFLNLKSLSFFKKVIFNNLKPGEYIIRIYRENPFLKHTREYIGYTTAIVEKETSTHVYCRKENDIQITVTDQNKNNIKNTQVLLYDEETLINFGEIQEKGILKLDTPLKSNKNYFLKIIYNGFLIDEKQIKTGLIHKIKPIKYTITKELYDFKLEILDTLGLKPQIELNPIITSKEMISKINIRGEKKQDDKYIFTNLTKAAYKIQFNYKSKIVNETINIPDEKEKTIIFPLEHKIKITVYNSRGQEINDYNIKIIRENYEKKGNYKELSLPPGNYYIEIYNENQIISSRNLIILGDFSVDLVSKNEPIYPMILIILTIITAISLSIYYLKKKQYNIFLKILLIALLVISILTPWWSINAEEKGIKTTTHLYIQPVEMVTITESGENIGGEISYLPDIFIDVINILFIVIIITIILTIFDIYIKKYDYKKLKIILDLIIFLMLLSTCIISFIAISEISNIGYGSIIGQGIIDVKVIGKNPSQSLMGSRGLSIGYYLFILSAIIAFFIIIKNKIKSYLMIFLK